VGSLYSGILFSRKKESLIPDAATCTKLEHIMNLSKRSRTQRTMGERGGGKGEVAQTMYTHVSKCKNNKKM
jgi:hypothetical protein